MTFDDFNKLQQSLISEMTKMQDTKGKEYSNSNNDRLANFKRVGKYFGVSPEVVCGIFMAKHWDSICNFIKNDCKVSTSEPIRGRLVDLMTYSTLLQGLLEEGAEKDKELKASFEDYSNDRKKERPINKS